MGLTKNASTCSKMNQRPKKSPEETQETDEQCVAKERQICDAASSIKKIDVADSSVLSTTAIDHHLDPTQKTHARAERSPKKKTTADKHTRVQTAKKRKDRTATSGECSVQSGEHGKEKTDGTKMDGYHEDAIEIAKTEMDDHQYEDGAAGKEAQSTDADQITGVAHGPAEEPVMDNETRKQEKYKGRL